MTLIEKLRNPAWESNGSLTDNLPAKLHVEQTRDTMEEAADKIERLRLALEMGLQLGESGKHGDGKNCPTCHFVRAARAALGRVSA